MSRWTNWSRIQQADPVRVETPRSVAEVSDAVRRAAHDGLALRMIGSGHSFTGVAVADGVQLRPLGRAGVRAVARATGVVTVDAGIDLTTLCHELHARGLGLVNMGDIRVQTLAGALQTGTHGTGRASGALASQVLALELVLADGTVTTVSREHDPDLFDAARVGLGAFGVLTAVTLQTRPAFLLEAKEEPRRLEEVLDGFDGWAAAHDHVEFYWFPHTDRCLLKRNDVVDGPAAPLSRFAEWRDDELLANSVFGVVNRLGRRAPGAVPRLNAVAGSLLSDRTYTDTSYRVFTSPRTVRFNEQEYAIPRDALVPAVREVVALLARSRWQISFPIEVRILPADDAWLSTAHGRASAYIAVHTFEGTPYAEYFQGVEAVLREHDGRPHWGKLHTRTAADLAPAYPRWADAMAVRDRVDPHRMFANPYLEQVLGA
jgi:FAD-linked oxidoreductase